MTQCERILAVLKDGKLHTAAELYRTGCVLHSRISDLRRRGYTIELSRADGVGASSYLYRLTATPGDASPRGAADSLETTHAGNHPPAAVSLASPGAGAATATAPDFIEGQLSLEDVAA